MSAIEKLCGAVLTQSQPGSNLAALADEALHELAGLRASLEARANRRPPPSTLEWQRLDVDHWIILDRDRAEPHYWAATCGACGWSGVPVEEEAEARAQYDLHAPSAADAGA